MTDLARRSEAALDESIVPPPASQSPAAAGFVLEGEYWTIDFGGERFRLRDSLGMRYLARLLEAPGREHLALDLATASSVNPDRPSIRDRSEGIGLHVSDADLGPQLDDQARTTYRERLRDLEEELREADAQNDAERVERARTEMDFLVRELSRAVGLGGHQRVVGSPTERARLSVTRAIRLAMKRIRDQSDSLGEHLEATIRTGTYCSYQPDPRLRIPWKVR